jgi:hypothetical protein
MALLSGKQLGHPLRDSRKALDAAIAQRIVEACDVRTSALKDERLPVLNEFACVAKLVSVQSHQLRIVHAGRGSHADRGLRVLLFCFGQAHYLRAPAQADIYARPGVVDP